MKIKVKWIFAVMFIGALLFGIDIVMTVSGNDWIWRVIAFAPAGLCALYFALESDWIDLG